MVVGRSIVGLAIGSASFVVPLYIAELSPSTVRGRLVTVSILFVTAGQVLAYVVGWLLSSITAGWRWMVGLGAIPAALQLAMLLFMPETPRWLVRAGRLDDAGSVLRQVYMSEDKVANHVLAQIRLSLEHESGVLAGANVGSSLLGRLVERGKSRRALIIACTLQASQQLCGWNSLMSVRRCLSFVSKANLAGISQPQFSVFLGSTTLPWHHCSWLCRTSSSLFSPSAS